jgi:hypothetical protein
MNNATIENLTIGHCLLSSIALLATLIVLVMRRR